MSDPVIATLRRLFFYQADQHAEMWRTKDDKTGYSPACEARFSDACRAQGYRCDTCAERRLTPLTEERLANHLASKITLGAYALRQDGTAGWLCLDIDADEATDQAKGNVALMAQLLLAKAAALSLPMVAESTGNKGIHLWAIVPDGVDAVLLKALGDWLVASIIEDEGEFAGMHVEVFPKQTSLAPGEFGNLVKVPLSKHLKTGRRCLFVDASLQLIGHTMAEQYAYLESIETATAEQIAELVGEWVPEGSRQPNPPFARGSRDGHGPLARQTKDFIVNGAAKGERNDRLFKTSADLAGNAYSQDEVLDMVTTPALASGLDADEVRQTVNSAFAKPRAPSVPDASWGEFPATDLGNAERLVAQFGGKLRYCYPWQRWFIWDGRRWHEDNVGMVERMAKQMARSIYSEAGEISDDDRAAEIRRWAKISESQARLRAAIELARSEPGIPVLPEQLDRNPWLLNCRNGTIDLQTGSLREHNPDDLITKLVPIDYNPGAQCPTWLAFEAQISGGDQDFIAHKQRAFGYALTGLTREQCFFVLYGTGSNGKTTELTTIKAVLGDDYAQQTPTETILAKDRTGGVPNDVARLRGARYVTATEAEEGKRLAESLVKQMTGGDVIVARFMRAEFFEFVPEFKLFLAVNHKPAIRGTDHAIWRRVRLWPYKFTVPDDQEDKDLPQKLLAGAEGILAWLVQGCLDWQNHGLGAPPAVLNATNDYRREMDVLGGFVDDCCVLSSSAEATSGDLHAAYSAWAERNNERAISKRAFGLRLQERGFTQIRSGRAQTRGWLGIGLLSSDSGDEM